MWDAWAAYDRTADGYFVHGEAQRRRRAGAREAAISYAAYRVLLWRYAAATGLQTTFDALTRTMASLCYRPGFTSTTGDSPAALGNRIAAAVIKAGLSDGSLEQQHYADPSYTAGERAAGRGAAGNDDARSDLLAAARARPDRLPERHRRSRPGADVHRRQWGHVRGSRCRLRKKGLPIDPGKPPFGSADSDAYKQAAVEVIRATASSTRTTRRRSTSARVLAATTRSGRTTVTATTVNPVTGKPYAPNLVRRADFARARTEFWADGPSSETPPGHWNVLANDVSDSPLLAARIGPEPRTA